MHEPNNTDNWCETNFSVQPMTTALECDEMPILDVFGTFLTFVTKVANTLIPGSYIVTVESPDSDIPADQVIMDVFDQTIVFSVFTGQILIVAQFGTVPAYSLN